MVSAGCSAVIYTYGLIDGHRKLLSAHFPTYRVYARNIANLQRALFRRSQLRLLCSWIDHRTSYIVLTRTMPRRRRFAVRRVIALYHHCVIIEESIEHEGNDKNLRERRSRCLNLESGFDAISGWEKIQRHAENIAEVHKRRSRGYLMPIIRLSVKYISMNNA